MWIDFASRTVSLDGTEVPIKSLDSEVCYRVSRAGGVILWARHRSIVEGRIVGQTNGGMWITESEKSSTLACGGQVVWWRYRNRQQKMFSYVRISIWPWLCRQRGDARECLKSDR